MYPEKGTHGPDGLFDKLVQALTENRPLKVKFGMDPTAPDLHLGHSVVLTKLRQFQDLGHTIQPLIGDYTTRIGDPSGRNTTRPPLTDAEIDANAKTYFNQVFKIVKNDPKTLDLHHNSEWLKNLTFADTIKLCAQVTVAQIIAREDFANRLAQNTPISMHELLYPIMQGYDSIGLMCDIELGGTDQTFNCLMGRHLMQARGLNPQIVITFPLLEGLDGSDKMSKSKGNYIGLTESAENIFGKTMSIPDKLLPRWFNLLTTVPEHERPEHPMQAKKLLAHTLTARFHTPAAANAAQTEFEHRFSNKELPTEIPEIAYSGSRMLTDIIVGVGFAKSKSEARRLIEQGGVKVNSQPQTNPATAIGITTPLI
ncbi:MAG: tyrosine--tRNA ligase, partial [Proteobacteria bacterium]|nr:tyrosine--tRNA ligase [Pseudomonadota bacterium]